MSTATATQGATAEAVAPRCGPCQRVLAIPGPRPWPQRHVRHQVGAVCRFGHGVHHPAVGEPRPQACRNQSLKKNIKKILQYSTSTSIPVYMYSTVQVLGTLVLREYFIIIIKIILNPFLNPFQNGANYRDLRCALHSSTLRSKFCTQHLKRSVLNNKASPPGRHQEQAPKQRCTFSPTTFSSVQC